MKKIIFISLLFFLAFYCFAEEEMSIDKANGSYLLYSSLSLPPFGFNDGLPNQTSVFVQFFNLNKGPYEREFLDLRITKYADYDNEPFLKVATPFLQGILIVGGLILGGVGFFSYGSDLFLPLVTGGSIAFSIGLSWVIIVL